MRGYIPIMELKGYRIQIATTNEATKEHLDKYGENIHIDTKAKEILLPKSFCRKSDDEIKELIEKEAISFQDKLKKVISGIIETTPEITMSDLDKMESPKEFAKRVKKEVKEGQKKLEKEYKEETKRWKENMKAAKKEAKEKEKELRKEEKEKKKEEKKATKEAKKAAKNK